MRGDGAGGGSPRGVECDSWLTRFYIMMVDLNKGERSVVIIPFSPCFCQVYPHRKGGKSCPPLVGGILITKDFERQIKTGSFAGGSPFFGGHSL